MDAHEFLWLVPLIFLGAFVFLLLGLLVPAAHLHLLAETGKKQGELKFVGGNFCVVFFLEKKIVLEFSLRGRRIFRFSVHPGKQRRPDKSPVQAGGPEKKNQGRGIRFWLGRNWIQFKQPVVGLVHDLQQVSLGGYLKLGLQNPMALGTLYGMYAVAQGVIPGLRENFQFIPEFQHSGLAYRVDFRASFRPGVVLYHAAKIYRVYRRLLK